MTLKTTELQGLHLPYGYLTTSYFRPVCPEATRRWLDLLISDDEIKIEHDGELMRLTALCDLPIMRYYGQDEPRSCEAGCDEQVKEEFDFVAEFSRLLVQGSTVDIWSLSPDGQPWAHTTTTALMN